MTARLPDEVGAQIVLSGRDVRSGNETTGLALRAIGLHAERIDAEHQRAIAFVEGVEVDLDVVVGSDAVAIGERRCHGSVRLVGANAEVHRVRRIPDEHVGRVWRGARVDRRIEREARE